MKDDISQGGSEGDVDLSELFNELSRFLTTSPLILYTLNNTEKYTKWAATKALCMSSPEKKRKKKIP